MLKLLIIVLIGYLIINALATVWAVGKTSKILKEYDITVDPPKTQGETE